MKDTTKKMLGRGKGVILAVAVVSLVIVAASPAMAGKKKPLSTLKLNLQNAVKGMTSMAGNVAGPVLKLGNDGTGSALELQVEPGKSPLSVNPEAGTATNLSADELDGKDSSQFITASTYRSISPPVFGTEVGSGNRETSWKCDPGDQLLSGGYVTVDQDDFAVVRNFPDAGNQWVVRWNNPNNPQQIEPLVISVLCADTAAPAHG